MANIEVDGRQLEVKDGIMLIEATDAAGIHIPRFCYHDKLSVAANCRMCLVEVEKAPKPLPACATPVMEGMKVYTQSEIAREAQKGTLEFLLINHPLDCPVCDQGGECPLQDQAVGYGKSGSRYHESKRVVSNHNIGPLVATEMTRCIHCTRCVRFGEEIAGVMEMGAPGRGEHTKIGTFLSRPINSEVSGNIIDLCPVGALTSKPYRFSARSWELSNHSAISPFDCLGSNINIQTLRGRVERILPIENDEINQCWLADRDRYGYEAVNSEQRLLQPMIRDGGEWKTTDWESALKHAAAGIKTITESGNATQTGALAGATSTLEEFYLLQKLMRTLGSENIDCRLQQSDFRDDDVAPAWPGIERPIAELDTIKSALLVGSNLRKEQPLLALRVRQAVAKGASVSAINPVEYDFNFDLARQITVAPDQMVARLAQLAAQVATLTGVALPDEMNHWCNLADTSVDNLDAIAKSLVDAGKEGVIISGAASLIHADGSVLRAICECISQQTGGKMMLMSAANSVAGHLAGCLPHRGPAAVMREQSGQHTQAMFAGNLRGYILFNCEPVLDSVNAQAAANALDNAGFVVQISAFQSAQAMQYADVLLPLAAFTENAGTMVNCEGRVQQTTAATTPQGEARPGWKILRVLGNFLELDDFDQMQLSDVTDQIDLDTSAPSGRLKSWWMTQKSAVKSGQWQRISEMPMYRGDATLRNSAALQATADNPAPTARLSPASLKKLSTTAGSLIRISDANGQIELPTEADARIPAGCVQIIAGHSETSALGSQGPVSLEAL